MRATRLTILTALGLLPSFAVPVGAQEVPRKPLPTTGLPVRQVLSCVPRTLTLQVRAGARVGDGSAARPFTTIQEALARAASERVCEAVVEIGRGAFAGPIELSRHTTLRGAGRDATVLRASIEQLGGRRLRLERLSLRATPGPALLVAHPAATTELREVTIDAASHHGIRQSGGALELVEVSISETTGGPSLYDGAAVYVDDGAQASLDNVEAIGNRQGVVASGGATKIVARRLEVSGGSSAFRTAAAYESEGEEGRGLGAVEVRGALMLVEDSRLSDNVGIGLLVAERGKLHARRVVIRGSRGLPSDDRFRAWGGIDLLLIRSQAQLSGLTIGDALVGVNAWESEVKSADLSLHDLALGMGLTSSDDPKRVSECLGLGTVRYDRVETPLSFQRPGGALALPPSPDGGGEIRCLLNPEAPECERRTGEFRPCAQVPWS